MGTSGLEHRPTEKSRQQVVDFSCSGFNQEAIAMYFDMSVDTLRAHYREELDKAKMEKTAALGGNLYLDALNGDKDDRMFWLKCQGRWSYAKPPEDNEKDLKQITLMEKLIDKL